MLETQTKVFLIMEFVEKGDLLEYLNSSAELSEDEIRTLFQQLVLSMAYCHREKVVHRDIKCENILLDGKGRLKVTGKMYFIAVVVVVVVVVVIAAAVVAAAVVAAVVAIVVVIVVAAAAVFSVVIIVVTVAAVVIPVVVVREECRFFLELHCLFSLVFKFKT